MLKRIEPKKPTETSDEDLRRAFAALRRSDSMNAPRFTPLRWVREAPAMSIGHRRRIAGAAVVAATLTIVIQASLVGWRPAHNAAPVPANHGLRVIRPGAYLPPPKPTDRVTATATQPAAPTVPTSAAAATGSGESATSADETKKKVASSIDDRIAANVPAPTPDSPEPVTVGGSRTAGDLRAQETVGSTTTRVQHTTGDTAWWVASADPRQLAAPAPLDREPQPKPVTVQKHTPPLPPQPPSLRSAPYRTLDATRDEQGRTLDGAISGTSRESYAAFDDNPFYKVSDRPLSTFAADVDTASYSNVRRYLTSGKPPPRDAVRVEELINYFDYESTPPEGDDPLGVETEVASCPWNPRHRLARITVAAPRDVARAALGKNLVFLIDVSGSMNAPNKLSLVKHGLSLLTRQLGSKDTVAIVVYAGSSGVVLPATPGSDQSTILDSIDRLQAGGSTAGAAGLHLAYAIADEHFVVGGVNRVILATDGDFNVGVTSHSQLLNIISAGAKRGVDLTALGFGMDNLQDDRLEQLADRGNGNYGYIDTRAEAHKILVEELEATLVTVAKDVKLQVEFNPERIAAYRLIGYENRALKDHEFNDDTKDAGEVGAGHKVTALYELVPVGAGPVPGGDVDPLRYSGARGRNSAAYGEELFTLKLRFKLPDEEQSRLRIYPVLDPGPARPSPELRFASAVAAFGMRLRQSEQVRDFHWRHIAGLGQSGIEGDPYGHRAEFLGLVEMAGKLVP